MMVKGREKHRRRRNGLAGSSFSYCSIKNLCRKHSVLFIRDSIKSVLHKLYYL